VVGGAQGGRPVSDPRRLAALLVAEEGDDPRLVDRHPALDEVAQLGGDDPGVLGEAQRGVARRPAAALLQRLRQVPVEQRRGRLDAALQHPLDQPAVEVEALAQRRAEAVGLDPRPGDREAVGLDLQRLDQVEVLAPAVVVVAGDVAGLAADDVALLVDEAVPVRLAAAVLADGALDLVGRGGDAEAEAGRDRGRRRRGRRGAGRRLRGAHPFTAPAVRPFTSQRWVAKKATTTGTVATTPAAINCAYSCE
jgi:hypothetical protein